MLIVELWRARRGSDPVRRDRSRRRRRVPRGDCRPRREGVSFSLRIESTRSPSVVRTWSTSLRASCSWMLKRPCSARRAARSDSRRSNSAAKCSRADLSASRTWFASLRRLTSARSDSRSSARLRTSSGATRSQVGADSVEIGRDAAELFADLLVLELVVGMSGRLTVVLGPKLIVLGFGYAASALDVGLVEACLRDPSMISLTADFG